MRPTLLLRYRMRLGGARLIPERLDLHPRPPPATHHVERTVECNVSDFGPFGSEPFDPIFPPQGWETVGTVLAWIAFGSAVPETEWDTTIYFGASEWVDLAPSEVPYLLTRVAEGAESLERRPCLLVQLNFEAPPVLYGTVTPDMLAAAAESKADTLTPAQMARAETEYEAIWAASEDLRRALARAELAIFGRRGNFPKPPGGWIATARERIPSEVFRAPVTVSSRGVLPVVRGHDFSDKYKILFSDLLLDADEVLRIWPDRRRPSLPLEHEHAVSKEKSAFSMAKLRTWYEDRIRSWPDGKPGPTEAQDVQAASHEMETTIPRDVIRGLRGEYAPANWLKPGPRKSRG